MPSSKTSPENPRLSPGHGHKALRLHREGPGLRHPLGLGVSTPQREAAAHEVLGPIGGTAQVHGLGLPRD